MESVDKSQLQLIGKIKDAHGIQGELLLIIFSKAHEPWLKLQEVFLAPDEKQTPALQKIQSLRNAKLGLIVRFPGVLTRNQAEALKGQLVFVAVESFKSQPGERLFLREILGFEVFDNGRLIGKISGFSSNGPQDIILIHQPGQRAPVEIPFVEDFIVKLDQKNKILKMDLPEGLIEVNSSPSDPQE